MNEVAAESVKNLTLAAPTNPLPPLTPGPGCPPPVCQGKGQKARLRKRSISTKAADVHVFRTEPSGRTSAWRGILCKTRTTGSLYATT